MSLQVGDLRVQSGERVTHIFAVPVGERTVQVPVIAINGTRDGPRVAVTGGIHGAEYVGIEAARRVGMGIDPAEAAGSLVVVPIANTSAFFARSIYTSALDQHNLNRVFPGNAAGAPSERLARWLFETVIAPSDYYIDMHGGDMIEALVPFVLYVESESPVVNEKARRLAAASGIPRVIRSKTQGSTYAAAAAAGIPAILAEIGGQGIWTEDEVAQHRESTCRVLRHLGLLPGGEPAPVTQHVYDSFEWLRAEVDGLLHPAVHVGDPVEKGQTVGAIVDYFGNERQRLEAPASGEVGFLVTSLAMNAGDPVLAVMA